MINPVAPSVTATTNSTTSVTVADTTGLAVGETVSGTGIPAGDTITAINGNVITLAQAATATGSTSLAVVLVSPTILATTTNASTTVTVGSTTGLYVGEQVYGPGIPIGATVASITNGTTFLLSANATASATVSMLAVNASDAIEAASGVTLTLTNAFSSGANSFIKLDPGTVAITADNTGWLGQTIISGGAVMAQSSNALGSAAANSGTIVLNLQGAALQLSNTGTSITVAEPLNLSNTGINTGGALENVAGTNTESGAITLSNAAAIGADAGSTLNLTGGISGAQALTFSGGGAINIQTVQLGAVASITKIGAGVTSLQVASPNFVGPITINVERSP